VDPLLCPVPLRLAVLTQNQMIRKIAATITFADEEAAARAQAASAVEQNQAICDIRSTATIRFPVVGTCPA
jgi:hypothetical protein